MPNGARSSPRDASPLRLESLPPPRRGVIRRSRATQVVATLLILIPMDPADLLQAPFHDSGVATLKWVSPISIRWQKSPRGVTAQVVSETGEESFAIDVLAPSEFGVSPRWEPHPTCWSMCAGLPRMHGGDTFRAVINAVRAVTQQTLRTYRWSPEHWTTLTRTERVVIQEACAVARDLALHAVALCNPSARRAALRFASHLRLSLHRWFVNDATGRLLQLVETCPGALIFAYGLMERPETREGGTALLDGVVAGHRLDRVLDGAIRAWAEGGPRDAGWHACHAWAVHGLESPGSASGVAARAAQRILIRRAGRRVPTTTLWQPPPIRLTPEDIPLAVLANARWFRAIKAAPEFYGGGTVPLGAADGPLRGVINLISRHPDMLFRPRGGGCHALRQRAMTLLNFARSHGRCWGRNTDPGLVAREVRKWSRAVRRSGENPAAWVFDSSPALFHGLDKPWSDGTFVARPLLTAAEFKDEGRTMSNCVVDRFPRAVSGHACYFHVDIEGRPLTLEVVRARDKFVTCEMAGPENAAVSPADVALVERFVGQVLSFRSAERMEQAHSHAVRSLRSCAT